MEKQILRAEILKWIREFFWSQNFLEVDTPSFVFSPGMEVHIRPIQVQHPGGAFGENKVVYLPTSPEFAMKKVLARLNTSHANIFQICKSYRLEPKSSTHHPEFTMLEWYRAFSDYEKIMDDVENLFSYLNIRVENFYEKKGGSDFVSSKKILKEKFKRISVEDCFRKFVGIELTEYFEREKIFDLCLKKKLVQVDSVADWDDCFFLLMMNFVEPALQKMDCPVIVYGYPASQAALANLYVDDKGFQWAKRFEVYAGGVELANAFDELTDSGIQRARFEKDMQTRQFIYKDDFPACPIDEEFLDAVSQLPASGGIALGVDRLVMLYAGATHIDDVLWLTSYF